MAQNLGNVGALARLEMAREKARVAGRKPALPSSLEQAAREWKGQEEQRERLRFQPGPEASVIAPVRMPLQARVGDRRTDETIGWRSHRWQEEDKPRRVVLNSAMISVLAMHLRAREWARAMGKPAQKGRTGFNLEKWAETWRRNKQLEERGLRSQP
ncbi:MAG: hypothetical protein ACE5I2_14575 [Anaerolineae bacterium]